VSSLSDALSTLSDRGLRRLLGARTFLRGLDYEKRKVVEDVSVSEASAQGRVKGSDPDPYEVAIRLGGEGITSSCTCPAFQKTNQHCKHVAALLITVRNKARSQLPRREAPVAPTGEGLVIVMNCSAGTTSDDLAGLLRRELPDARVMIAGEGDEPPGVIAEAAGGARILGIAGGDGSVQVAAGLAADKGLPLLVIPAGTFNHFATDLGVRSAQDALDAVRAGDSVLVDVAQAGQQSFLNTASTGVYVDLVRAREELEERLGQVARGRGGPGTGATWPGVPVDKAWMPRSCRSMGMKAASTSYDPVLAVPE